jgi:hypothetical protein
VRRLKSPHAIYMRASRNPKVVELLTDPWGSLRYDSGKLNMKSAGYGAPIEWHQDREPALPSVRARFHPIGRARTNATNRCTRWPKLWLQIPAMI